MSHSSSHKLDQLAPELLQLITAHICQDDDLRNLRLSNRTLNTHARKELFRSISLRPTEDSIKKWNSITKDKELANIPQNVTLYSSKEEKWSSGDWFNSYDPEGDGEGPRNFVEGILSLWKLPQVKAVQLNFTQKCSGKAGSRRRWRDQCESIEERERLMKLLFEAIEKRCNRNEDGTCVSPITSLTLRNLQNSEIDFTSSDLFRSVMSTIDQLHIQMVQEYNEAGPDNDYSCEELRTFPSHLVSKWLAPVSENLKKLSLYAATDNWGPFPGLYDFSRLSFPRLETLYLGYYTIAHDDQLDWVLAQKSLTKLVMHNCMIVCDMRFFQDERDEWKLDTHGWEVIDLDDEDDDEQIFQYRGKWAQFFDKMGKKLPNLKEFRFDYHHPGSPTSCEDTVYGYQVDYKNRVGTNLHSRRYLIFDRGILPTHWPEASDDGTLSYHFFKEPHMIHNYHKLYRNEDQQSLNRLLEKCQQRALKEC